MEIDLAVEYLFPALAGMNRSYAGMRCPVATVPRISGDEPNPEFNYTDEQICSPH